MNNLSRKKGFTLIEVLIALVILSIALTAIIKATSQNIRDTAYLQNKTIATWVGVYVLNQARLRLINLPLDEGMEQETVTLGKKWLWHGSTIPTPNNHIKKIQVDVYDLPGKTKLVHLESFYYAPEQ